MLSTSASRPRAPRAGLLGRAAVGFDESSQTEEAGTSPGIELGLYQDQLAFKLKVVLMKKQVLFFKLALPWLVELGVFTERPICQGES